ncbi:MAG: arginine ABC transporter substrate-binding protein [Legionella sp. 40-6]|nr:transporter substrate-binding domain-containing protein [Legionella sp.]OJY44186.1 MAG: arginine ABC transporter substrate-binding protein [Legionella sp. 40-6]
MIRIFRLISIWIIALSTCSAQDLPILNIGTESFNPPFVIQGSKKEIYGFDIDLMNALCRQMERTCNYRIMRFDELLPAVTRKEIDIAISSITITPERAKIVTFSLPYLPSYSRFMMKTTSKVIPFSLDFLNNKKIGLESGTVFEQQLLSMGVKNPKIKFYKSISDQLTGLNNGDVELLLIDNPTARYWSSNSSANFMLAGPSYMYGYGLGIAINNDEQSLLTAINEALLRFQNSPEYKQNYDRYLAEF